MFENIANFFRKLVKSEAKQTNSKDTAKERLKLVLIHDRASLSPGLVEELRQDLIAVISKYMEFDEQALDVQVNSEDNIAMLEVNIPISHIKRQYEDI